MPARRSTTRRAAARRPAAADPRRSAHRSAQALHPRPRRRGRARGAGGRGRAAGCARRRLGQAGRRLDRPTTRRPGAGVAGRRCWPMPSAARTSSAPASPRTSSVRTPCPALIAAGLDSIEHGTGLTDDLIDEVGRRGAGCRPDADQHRQLPEHRRAGEAKFPIYAAHMRALYATSRERIRLGVGGRRADLHRHRRRRFAAARPDPRRDPRARRGRHPARRGHRAGVLAGAGVARPARIWTRARPADLVVFDTDPRSDLATLAEPQRIVLRGAVVS